MAEPDYSGAGHWRAEQEKNLAHLRGGGGGDRFDPMEPRVAALEKGFERIERKLDTLAGDVAEIKGQLRAVPSATNFGDIKGSLGKLEGRVDSLPTTAKLATLLGIAVALITIVTKWADLVTFFRGA